MTTITLLTVFVVVILVSHKCDAYRTMSRATSRLNIVNIKHPLKASPVNYRGKQNPLKMVGLTCSDERSSPPRLSYALLWIGLVGYAFGLAPGGSAEAAAIDSELISKMISTPFDGTTNPIFVALFNFLGILPAINASLLLPGAKDQKPVPALPFIVGSFALGFFGIGPYLGLRSLRTQGVVQGKGIGNTLVESKLSAVGMLLFALYLCYYAVSNVISSGGGVAVDDFVSLFSQQRLVHVSTVDFAILSLSVWDPLREDMSRRYPNPSSSTSPIPAWVFCAVPVVGPVIYLLTRPRLPMELEEVQQQN